VGGIHCGEVSWDSPAKSVLTSVGADRHWVEEWFGALVAARPRVMPNLTGVIRQLQKEETAQGQMERLNAALAT
jgi:hypothetical protein